MSRIAIILLLLTGVCRADIVFSWTNCPNHLNGSATIVWQGTQSTLNYSTSYTTTGTNFTFSEGWLHGGMNYFACQQIATNHDGSAMPTPFSGEIQVRKIPAIQVTVPILSSTNLVLTSTNLGQNWVDVGTVSITFPTTDAQRFFMAGQIKATRAVSQIVLPPIPK